MKNWGIFIALSFVFLSSCMKEEQPIQPHEPGELETNQVEMGIYYPDQVWFDMETGMEVARNHKTDWDLAFENNTPGWRITMNSALNARLAKTGTTDITQVTDTTGADWLWDEFSGNLDSTAMGDWRDNPEIYILKRGQDEFGKYLGTTKLLIDSVSDTHFHFRHAEISQTNWTSATIAKDSNYFFSYFSLKGTGNQVQIAPPTKDWDLLFTQYTFVFYDMIPIVPYLVTGVVLNHNQTYSRKVFDKSFESITSKDLVNYDANQRIDNIGYDWKWYDFDARLYITDPSKNYVFISQTGKAYKIHFLDWYNENGEKGTPTFEYAEL